MVSIRLLQAVGVNNARDYVARFGLPEDKMPQNLTLALGTADVLPIQMVTGYATLANGGFRVLPYFIDKVVDLKGTVLFQANPARVCHECEATAAASPGAGSSDVTQISGQGSNITVTPPPAPVVTNPGYPTAPRIMNARTAFQIDSILADVIRHGTATAALKMNRSDISGKTGTTNDAKDAWFSGFNPKLVATAWVGFDGPQPLGRLEYGGYAALPIWIEYMSKALNGTPVVERPMPTGLTMVRVNKQTGQRAADGDPDSIPDWIQTERLSTLGTGIPEPAAGSGPTNGPQVAPEELF
jgi:penicillin-binding protein 1A